MDVRAIILPTPGCGAGALWPWSFGVFSRWETGVDSTADSAQAQRLRDSQMQQRHRDLTAAQEAVSTQRSQEGAMAQNALSLLTRLRIPWTNAEFLPTFRATQGNHSRSGSSISKRYCKSDQTSDLSSQTGRANGGRLTPSNPDTSLSHPHS